MWRSLFFALLFLIAQPGNADERLLKQEVGSKFLNASRTIRIYLPASYRQQADRRYPVLYLHDGQNVFSSAGTNICFGWGSWALDKTVDELCTARRMREIIMVAVDHTRSRYKEYRGMLYCEDGKPGRKPRA